jgi:hypothetical protein
VNESAAHSSGIHLRVLDWSAVVEERELAVEQKEQDSSRWGFRGKTFWNWLELLVVPLAPVGIGFAFDLRQQGIEDQRAERAREIEEQRAQDDALQAYLDQMSTLLLEKDLCSSTEDNATEDSKEARTLARARTLTVLGRLDPNRKPQVMQFLLEADLVGSVDESGPIIGLRSADLSRANLFNADLINADLSGAYQIPKDSIERRIFPSEELKRQAKSLKGATMPDGQKNEDGLKDEEGCGEDGKNGGSS